MPRLGDRCAITCPDTPLMLIGREPGPDGKYGREVAGAPLPRDANDPAIWLPGQGRANACGTTTLAYVLRYLLGEQAPARSEIDDQLRRGNIFSAPMLLVGYARRCGLVAQAYNRASTDLLFELLNRGVPVMVLMDTTPLNLRDTANLHWVALVAHCGDRVGIYNPHGFQEELDIVNFKAHWQQACIFGLPAWNNFAIAISREFSTLPAAARPDASFLGANLAAGGVAGVVNSALGTLTAVRQANSALSKIGNSLRGFGVLLGAIEAVAGGAVLLVGALIEKLARPGQRKSDR